jgi:DNA-binding XRE family transcriptional regulator
MERRCDGMQNGEKNIYRRCRVDARYTREAAAEMISVSVRSLADYEAGRTVPKILARFILG